MSVLRIWNKCTWGCAGVIRLTTARDAQPAAHVSGLECSDVQWQSLASEDSSEGHNTSAPTGIEEERRNSRSTRAMLDLEADEAKAHDSADRSHVQGNFKEKVLSCTLTWLKSPITDMYHISYQSKKKGSDLLGDSAQWTHLGSTGLSSFRAVGMRLHGTDDAICVAVSASSSALCWDYHDRTTSLLSVL